MKRTLGRVVVLTMALAPTVAWAQDSIQERINRIERGLTRALQIGPSTTWTIQERMQHYRVPGLSIAVINNFKVEWSRQYGVRDSRTGESVTDSTLFQIASITKPVTATVALKLVERGVLDLDRDVNEYLKSWKVPENEFTREEKVTLRRILSHSAGLTVPGFRGYAEGEAVPNILQVLDGKPPANSAPVRVDMKPGSGARYSGGGYTVLQLIIEDVTGRPLAELIDELVLKPAGMKESSLAYPLPAALAARRSSGHDESKRAFTGYAFVLGGSGCCGLWTTAADLAKFGTEMQRALRGDTDAILRPTTAKMMATPTNSETFGLGWELHRYGSTTYLAHGGGNPGFGSLLIVHPTAGYGAAILMNANTDGLPGEILNSIASEYAWDWVQPRSYPSTEVFISHLREVYRERPNDPEVSEAGLNRLGYGLIRTGPRDAALQVFALDVELNPQSANCFDSLAEAHESFGDFSAALVNYRKAIEVLDRHPARNASYARYRDKTMAKIRELEEKTPKKPE